ncbi:MAG: hypothetical protein RI842_09490 [Schleiferiaceae bacterium]|nr:hypothetical protein [Schleiferiaceae bacterium]
MRLRSKSLRSSSGLFFAWLLLPLFAQAQNKVDSITTLNFGIYAGYYMPNNATAAYYSGQDNNRLKNLLNNRRIRDQIENSLGGYPFELREPANNMSYNNAFSFELELDYRFPSNWSLTANFIRANLRAEGNFTLEVQRVNRGQSTVPYIERALITGEEERSHINLGLAKIFTLQNEFYALAQGGIDFNFVEVSKNQMIIADRNYRLSTNNLAQNNQQREITTSGIGFFVAGGLGYELNSGYGIRLKTTVLNTSINVNEVVEKQSTFLQVGLGFTKRW